MERIIAEWRWVALSALLVLASAGAVPASRSYSGIEKLIDGVKEAWKQSDTPVAETSSGWETYFGALRNELQSYASAESEDERVTSLNRIYELWRLLGPVQWKPAQQIRAALTDWLRPRVELAWAERRLTEAVERLRPTNDPNASANRKRWTDFVANDLGKVLGDFEAAGTAAQQRAALKRLKAAIEGLEEGNSNHPWAPSRALAAALDDLYSRPNVDLKASVDTLAPALDRNVVTPGPIFFKGQWSYVTPGPKTGFGLLYSNDGLAFYNRQRMTSITPIRGFQEQLEQDERGRKAAKLYYFDATTRDDAELTITAVVKSDGLRLTPSYQHNVSASICSAPTAGHGMGRAIAGLIGMNQGKITGKVEEGAMPRFQQGVVEGAMELGTIRTAEAAAEQNQKLRQYLVGNNTVVVKDICVKGLRLGSRPDGALVEGTLCWNGGPNQESAWAPAPGGSPERTTGVSAKIHLPSILGNMLSGLYQSPTLADMDNIMIVRRKVGDGEQATDAVKATKNVDFATYAKVVDEIHKADDPESVALRFQKPKRPAEFITDARGLLVVFLHDLVVDVPAPTRAGRGGAISGPPAKIYRLTAPEAELAIAFKVDPAVDEAHHAVVRGKLAAWDPGPKARVYAIMDDEKKATPLTNFSSALVLRFFGARLQTETVDIPVDRIKLRGLALQNVSPLDPSGWLHVTFMRTHDQIKIETTPAPATASRVPANPSQSRDDAAEQ
jgi:hypothetical protein